MRNSEAVKTGQTEDRLDSSVSRVTNFGAHGFKWRNLHGVRVRARLRRLSGRGRLQRDADHLAPGLQGGRIRITRRCESPNSMPAGTLPLKLFLRLSLYRLVAEMNWNESDVDTPRLIEELKEAARREGLSVPGNIHKHLCLQSPWKS